MLVLGPDRFGVGLGCPPFFLEKRPRAGDDIGVLCLLSNDGERRGLSDFCLFKIEKFGA